ncbi:hypothetical protein TNCV_1738001 [Trichonephila clavipes]|nr:hypothetical protein TNCV_1738001 [Trichonephila clavipes]
MGTAPNIMNTPWRTRQSHPRVRILVKDRYGALNALFRRSMSARQLTQDFAVFSSMTNRDSSHKAILDEFASGENWETLASYKHQRDWSLSWDWHPGMGRNNQGAAKEKIPPKAPREPTSKIPPLDRGTRGGGSADENSLRGAHQNEMDGGQREMGCFPLSLKHTKN